MLLSLLVAGMQSVLPVEVRFVYRCGLAEGMGSYSPRVLLVHLACRLACLISLLVLACDFEN